MAIQGVDTKCYILALFVRDDGERFLLGSGHYEFKDTQMHFAANAIQNDIVEVQGNDGFLLAGQVRRPGTQSFDGYVGDGTMSKEETESYRRQFFSFFRKNFFYKVIYVFSDGTAIQRKSGFLVDDPTVQELYQMYPEYHVALNFEDVNYYSYSEDEEGQEQYAKEATIDTSSMRATGGLVWDNLGAVWEDTQWGGEQTASGTEMTIQNDMDVPSRVDGIRLDGDTEQETYSGKNLFNKNATPFSKTSNTLVTVTETGIRVTQNTATTSNMYATYIIGDFSSFADQVITLSADMTISGQNTSRLALGYCKADGSSRTTKTTLNTSGQVSLRLSATELAEQPYLYIYAYANTSGGEGQAGDYVEYTDLQLELNSTATSYEPYTGGIPSPNPDYPQDIHTVTGEQTVEMRGKNLFYGVNTNSQGLIATWTGSELSLSGTSISTWANITAVLERPLPAGTYTFSIDEPTDLFRLNIRINYDGSNHDIRIAKNTKSVTFTVPDGARIRLCHIDQLASGTTFSGTYRFQLEEGSTATAYEPYQSQSYTIDLGSTELCKIGTYQDYIYKSDDDWFVHKECGKVVLDGSESWQRNDANEVFTLADTALYMRDGTSPFSNYFIGQANVTSFGRMENNKIGLLESATNNRIIIKYTAISTVSAFKTWLSTHITNLYYPLATPTDTKITDNTLVGQLNALGAMRLFIGENNLAIQATGTNLPAPLSFKYYTTVAMTGAEWEEGGSGGATVVEVDSITNTYPIWRVKGPAVNPQLSVINTNTTIRYTGTVTSTQTLEIDMFNKTAKLNGVSVIGNVSGDWVSLAPGTNRVIYTAENADAQPSTIEWQEVVG